jgi:hypothetical protein
VPTSALRTLETVKPKIKKNLPAGSTVHALLAADLALERPNSKYAPWTAIHPSRESVARSLPLAWADPALHAYLPRPARTLLEKQQAKFARDWSAMQNLLSTLSSSYSSTLKTDNREKASPTVTQADFLYAWLLVNTRTFYHETRRTARLSRDDRMVLQPVADLFNHTSGDDRDGSDGCEVAFTPAGFSITADRVYAPGEEVCICYGRHSDDFLLVEYGFVLGGWAGAGAGEARNRWDEVCLDDALLLPEDEDGDEDGYFDRVQREVLDQAGFLGNYRLDERAVCYRTQVALRLLVVGDVETWKRLVEEGEDGGEDVQRAVDQLLAKVLKRYLVKVEAIVEELGRTGIGEPCQREVLRARWTQISHLIRQTIERLSKV